MAPRKPEPSMLTRGRAKAKGTDREYVTPNPYSAAYAQDKLRQSGSVSDLRSSVPRAPADDTAAGFANHGVHTDRINAALRKAGHL